MFEQFSSFKVLHMSKVKSIEFIDPNYIRVYFEHPNEMGKSFSDMILCKEARSELHKALGVKWNISRDLQDISNRIWSALISSQMGTESFKEFMLNSILVYKEYSDQGIDSVSIAIAIIPQEERQISVKEIEDKLTKIDETILSGGSIFSECYSVNKVITPVIHDIYMSYEIDIENSSYKIYAVRLIPNTTIVVPLYSKPIVEEYSLYKFLDQDLQYEIDMIKRIHSNPETLESPNGRVKLSVREIINLISWSKMKVVTDEETGFMKHFKDIEESKTTFISEYLSSFGMAFKTLKKLSETRKALKYSGDSIDFFELLSFIGNCYLSDMGNSCMMDMGIINYLLRCGEDSDYESIKEELKLEV